MEKQSLPWAERERVSPNTNSSSSSSGSSGPLTPKTITRSEINACPTTFVQADTSSFKQVVQMLTGSTKSPADPPTKAPTKTGPKKQAFKLHERRNCLKNLNISPLVPAGFQNPAHACFSSPRNPEILSPSMLNFPSLALSPVTPLIPDPFNRSPTPTDYNTLAEERAIAEKGFYLHPSPSTTPRDTEPKLLPLFPITSPKVSGSPS